MYVNRHSPDTVIDAQERVLRISDTANDAADPPPSTPDDREAEETGSREGSSEILQLEDAQTDGDTPIVSVQADGRIDINRAGLTELMTLKGIGEKKAADIIDYRTKNGMFASIEDIMKVPGIKEGTFSKIRDMIKV